MMCACGGNKPGGSKRAVGGSENAKMGTGWENLGDCIDRFDSRNIKICDIRTANSQREDGFDSQTTAEIYMLDLPASFADSLHVRCINNNYSINVNL